MLDVHHLLQWTGCNYFNSITFEDKATDYVYFISTGPFAGGPAAKMEFQDQLFSKFQDNFRTYLRYQKPQQIQIYYELSSTNQS